MLLNITVCLLLLTGFFPILTASVAKHGNSILKDFLMHPAVGKCDIAFLEDGTRGPPQFGVSLQNINR